jgi:hypothetical protein
MLKFSNINPGPDVSHVSLIYLAALSSSIQSGSFYTENLLKVAHVEQELLTFPEHLSSPPVFSRVRVAQSLVFVDMFVDRCFFFLRPLSCSLFDSVF